MTVKLLVGGAFAPPITDEHLNRWLTLFDSADPQVKEAALDLHNLVVQHQGYDGDEKPSGTPHPSGVGTIVPLSADKRDALDEHLPWREHLDMYAALFDRVTDKPLRDAVHHLLWYAKELDLGREPMTTDKI